MKMVADCESFMRLWIAILDRYFDIISDDSFMASINVSVPCRDMLDGVDVLLDTVDEYHTIVPVYNKTNSVMLERIMFLLTKLDRVRTEH